MTDHPPSGWYPDPEDPSLQRYWNGFQWTEHTAPGVARAESDGDDGGAWSTGGTDDVTTDETGAERWPESSATGPPPPGPVAHRAGDIDTWSWQAWVVTLLCGGTFISMIGIYNAGKAEGAIAAGDLANGHVFARRARGWTLGGLAFGVLWIAVVAIGFTALVSFAESAGGDCTGVGPDDGIQYTFCQTLCQQDPAASECIGFAG